MEGCDQCRRERSRAVTAVFGGLDVGSAVGLVLCGPIIKHLGWPSVFYLFAFLGVLWTLLFPRLNPDEPDMLVPSELQPDSPGVANTLDTCTDLHMLGSLLSCYASSCKAAGMQLTLCRRLLCAPTPSEFVQHLLCCAAA